MCESFYQSCLGHGGHRLTPRPIVLNSQRLAVKAATQRALFTTPADYNKGLYTKRAVLLLQLAGSSVPYVFTILHRHVAFRLS